MTKSLGLAASANMVHLVTQDGLQINMTPELADKVSLELTRKAAQARVLSSNTETVATMSDALRALGYLWHVDDPDTHTGHWEMSGVAMNTACAYEIATRSLYLDLITPLPINFSSKL